MLLERLWRLRLAIMLTSVGTLAALLRFVGLAQPRALVFDELYYARGAYSLLHQGYEGVWTKGNDGFIDGDFSGLEARADFVVHPPLGKWMIAAGIKAFGTGPFGWRVSAALIGTLTVVLVALIGYVVLRSLLFGGLAGLFLAVDGEHVVASRTALLDVFLTFFVVLAFLLLLLDRRRHRRALRRRADARRESLGLASDAPLRGLGPRAGVRWWRLAALVSLGLATGVKWSGLYFALVFMTLSLVWDAVDRRRVGVRSWVAATVVRSALPAFVATLLVLPATYVASWSSWFAADQGYMRQWAATHEDEGISWLPDTANSFLAFHDKIWDFHTGLTYSHGIEHGYAANPWGFIIQFRPTAYYWETDEGASEPRCGASKCVSAITALGNPLLWWAGAGAFGYAVYRAVRRRDLLAVTVASGIIAGWCPWLLFPDRVMFTFYSVAFAPWMMLTLAWALSRIAKPRRLEGAYSRRGGLAVGGFVAASLIVAGLFLPLYLGQWIPYYYWGAHMWLGMHWV